MKSVTIPSLLICIITVVVNAQQQATLLGRWHDDDLVGSNLYNNIYNEVWGLYVNGREYAVIGSTAGTHIIDITDPEEPVQTNFIPGTVMGGEIIHRDFKDYQGYLYAVADEGLSALQIIDVRNLPNTAPVVYENDDLIRRTHNIYIDKKNALMYAFFTRGETLPYSPMRVFDLSDPENPVPLAAYDAFGGQAISQVHDGYVRDNIAFLNCGGDGLFIVDFNDVYNPVLLRWINNYPDKGYNHSGWLSDDGNYYYMADENHSLSLKSIDVSNACEAEVAGTFNAEVSNPFAITHNQIAACGYLYTSYYYDGLQVFDIADRENPVKVLEYDTYPQADAQSYKGAWGVHPLLPSGVILISDMQTGLYVFEGVGDDCYNVKEIRSLDDPCSQSTASNEGSFTDGIFPNPAGPGQTLHVEMKEGHAGPASAWLHALDGRLVQSWPHVRPTGRDLSLYIRPETAPGFYILNIATGTGRAAFKIKIAGR